MSNKHGQLDPHVSSFLYCTTSPTILCDGHGKPISTDQNRCTSLPEYTTNTAKCQSSVILAVHKWCPMLCFVGLFAVCACAVCVPVSLNIPLHPNVLGTSNRLCGYFSWHCFSVHSEELLFPSICTFFGCRPCVIPSPCVKACGVVCTPLVQFR